MTYGLVLEDVERLALLDPRERQPELDPRNIAAINDIGAAVESEQTLALLSGLPLDAVIHTALKDTLGNNRHAVEYQAPIDGRRPLAQIKGFGIARGQSSPDNEMYTDGLVEAESGCMIVTLGNELEARTATQAFERKVRTSRAGLINAEEAGSVMQYAMNSAVPRVIRAVRQRLGVDPGSTEVRASGVQIVRNQVVHDGRDPLLVLDTKTGEVTRLAYNATSMERGIHELNPGRYIVMLCNSTNPDFIDTNTNTLSQALQDAWEERMDPTPEHPLDTNDDRAQAKTAQIAASVQAALGGAEQGVTVVATAVEVARPWRDGRSKLRQLTDWGRLATLATMAAARIFDPTVRDLHRRQAYERMKQDGIRGKIGQAALWTVDVTLATGLPLLALRLAAPELTHHLSQSLGQEVSHVGHLLGLPGQEHAATAQSVHTGTQAAAGGSQLTESQLGAPSVSDDMTPQQLAHAAGRHPAAPQLPDSYTALADDPHLGGGPSTIYGIDRYLLGLQGQAHGLTPDQIAGLQHNDQLLDGGVTAFIGDQSNANNGLAKHNYQTGIDANVTYSVRDLEAHNEEVIKSLFPDSAPAQPAPQPQAADVAAPGVQPQPAAHAAAAAVPPVASEHSSHIEKIAMGGTVGGVAATAIGVAAWFGIPRARSWFRNRRGRAAAVPVLLPLTPQEEPPEVPANPIDRQAELIQVAPDEHAVPLQSTAESSAGHTPRHLNLATPAHTPLHLDPTEPDGEPESGPLLGLEQIEMPVVPGLNLNPRVPRAPRPPFGPEQVDGRAAYVDAAYRAFRSPMDTDDIEIHWQKLSDQWAIIDARRNKNPLVRLGRRLFGRDRQPTPEVQPDPNLTNLEDYNREPEGDRELIAA